MLVALVLDLEIIKRSNGTKKLDDVMRYLYKTYYKEKGRGFSENEFAESLKAVTGSSFDDILQAMIYRSDAVNYNSYLNYVGLELQNQPSNKLPMGITTKVENGKTLVKYVELDKPGSKAGLSVNDEIIAINGLRVNGDLDEFIATFKEGEKVDLIISRLGKIITLTFVPEKDTAVNYKVVKIEKEQSEAVKALYNFWIK
jgi:predicted metalloprotease with PDZ domain